MKNKVFIPHLLALALGLSTIANVAHANTPATLSDGVVAVVNDEVVLKSELTAVSEALSREYQTRGVSPNAQQIRQQALDTLINRKLQLGLIKRAGMVPNDEVINRQILQIAQSQGFNSLTQFQAALDGQKAGSYASLRNQLIEDAALEALTQYQVNERIKISDQEVKSFLDGNTPEAQSIKQAQSQYQLTHVRVPLADDNAAAQANQAASIQAALQQGQSLEQVLAKYKNVQGTTTPKLTINALPAHIAERVSSLNVGDVAIIAVDDGLVDVVRVDAKEGNARILMPEWQTSHILARVDDTQNNSLAEQKINALYAELQKGANFAELAATYSDDAGSAAQRGSLGWVSENQMVPEFEAVMKNTQTGDFSTPFRSQFGWHILKVDNSRQRDVTEQYRSNLAREVIFSRLAPQAQEDWIQEMRAGAYIKILDEQ